MSTSPYLAGDDAQRLQDIMTAIQVMGTYKSDSRSGEQWRVALGKPRSGEDNWMPIFEEHPEFFNIEPSEKLGQKVNLRWRRALEETYDTKSLRNLTQEEKTALLAQDPDAKIGRPPLPPEHISTLLTLAINLHTRAEASSARRRWWILALLPPVSGLVGVLIGALLQ